MPYIKSQLRKNFDFSGVKPQSPGELNYVITKICDEYLQNKETNYETFNSIMGVLQCVALEFYRRIVSNYEQIKQDENGDVYTTKFFFKSND